MRAHRLVLLLALGGSLTLASAAEGCRASDGEPSDTPTAGGLDAGDDGSSETAAAAPIDPATACDRFFDLTHGELARDLIFWGLRSTPRIEDLDPVTAQRLRAWAHDDCVELMGRLGPIGFTGDQLVSAALTSSWQGLFISPLKTGQRCSLPGYECHDHCLGVQVTADGVRHCGTCGEITTTGIGGLCKVVCYAYTPCGVGLPCARGLTCVDAVVTADDERQGIVDKSTCLSDPLAGNASLGESCNPTPSTTKGCQAGLHCGSDPAAVVNGAPDASTCSPAVADGGACLGKTTWCEPGEACFGAYPDASCEPRRRVGEPCEQSEDCTDGLRCGPFGPTCARRPVLPDASAGGSASNMAFTLPVGVLPGDSCAVGGPPCFFGQCGDDSPRCPRVVADGEPCGRSLPDVTCGPVSACNPVTQLCERRGWSCVVP